MIDLIKRRFMIAFLFCLLIGIAIMPIVLLKVSNDRLMDRPAIVALPWEPSIDETQIGQNSYDALTRLLSIQRLSVEKNSFIVDWSVVVMSKDQESQLLLEAGEQLSILASLKALPKLDFSDRYSADIAKKTYMDMENPNNPINIWRINADYSNVSVNLYMDMDTSVIYQVLVILKTEGKEPTLYNLSADGFLEYLQSNLGSNEREGELFQTMCDYNESSVKIFVTSTNKETQAVTSYEFEKQYDYRNVEEKGEYIEQDKKVATKPYPYK